MKKSMLLCLLLCAATVRAETVLATAKGRFGPDARPGSLAVVMTAGRLVNDTEPWCGAGRRYEGHFVLRVRLPGKPAVESDLNRLMGASADEPLAFPARKWKPLLNDYSGKGMAEFTLGQYASCNGWRYRILAVLPDGKVAERPLQDGQTLFLSSREPSVSLPVAEGGFRQRFYDNSRPGDVTRFYRWDEEKQAFVPR